MSTDDKLDSIRSAQRFSEGFYKTYTNAAAAGLLEMFHGGEVIVMDPIMVQIVAHAKVCYLEMLEQDDPQIIERHLMSIAGAMVELLRVMDRDVTPLFTDGQNLYFGKPAKVPTIPLTRTHTLKDGKKKWQL